MKFTPMLVPILTVLATFAAGAEEPYDPYKEATVVWESEEPTCFDKTLPLRQKLESVPQLMVGGEITAPKTSDGPKPTIEELEATQERPWVLVFVLVIGADGKAELIVSLKGGYPRMDELAGKYLAKWTWEPATVDGKPVCVRYIMTQRIHYL